MRHIDDDDGQVLRDGQRLRVSTSRKMACSVRSLRMSVPSTARSPPTALRLRIICRAIASAALMRGTLRGAYAEMVERTSSAWRTPARVEADREEAVVAARDAVMSADADQRVRDQAYASYVARISSAWKGRG